MAQEWDYIIEKAGHVKEEGRKVPKEYTDPTKCCLLNWTMLASVDQTM